MNEIKSNTKIKEYILLFVSFLLILYVYLFSMHPVFKTNDSPETTVAAITLGIGHPPGYPLFAVFAKIFSFFPPGNYAFKINIFSSFLAILILFVTYHIIKFLSSKIFNTNHLLLNIIFIFILSFSYIFWDQAIEAKGGIYMLNLLFLSILIFLSLRLFYEFNISYLYLFYFVFSLSLANHWQSMIILSPVFIYFLYRFRKKLSLLNYFLILFFLLLGLTPYLFLVIRAIGDALLNWGDPDDLKKLLWVVLRKAYINPIEPSLKVYIYQIKEYFSFTFWHSIFLFWIFSFAGIYILYKKNKNLFFFILSIYLLNVFFVIFYNRTPEDILYLINIFLMPSIYILFLFSAIGILYIFNKIGINIINYSFYMFVLTLIIIMFLINLNLNNKSKDFFSYDYGNAILNTIEDNGVYIGDGDDNLMPVYYLQELMKKRTDIKFFTSSFLIFQWGIDYYINKYGDFDFKPFDASGNIKKIIVNNMNKNSIYRSSYFTRSDNLKNLFFESNKGILIRISNKKHYFSSKIYDLYSYRYLFDNSCIKNKANINLITWYPVSMVNQANALNEAGFAEEAIKLYKRALNFPVRKPEANIYYNLALAYSKINDIDMEIDALKNVIKRYPLLYAFERLGILYYNSFFLPKAKEMFDRAIKMGSKNEYVLKINDILSTMSYQELYEHSFIKANEFLINKKINDAMKIYNFLLEKDYKSAIIYRNLGVYYFETGNYGEALKFFKMSKNATYNSEISLYLGYVYFKMGKYKEALLELQEGIEKFNDNKDLKKLLDEIKSVKLKNEKNFNSIER